MPISDNQYSSLVPSYPEEPATADSKASLLEQKRAEKLRRHYKPEGTNAYENLSNGSVEVGPGVTEYNSNKVWNALNSSDLQATMADVAKQAIGTNPDGSMYQIGDNGEQVPYEGPTERLYGYHTQDDPNTVKFGLSLGSKESSDARYVPKDGYGWAPGPKGVDISKPLLFDMEGQNGMLLPKDLAVGMEGLIHGNKNALDHRVTKDLRDHVAKEAYGSGVSEYYTGLEGVFGDSRKSPSATPEELVDKGAMLSAGVEALGSNSKALSEDQVSALDGLHEYLASSSYDTTGAVPATLADGTVAPLKGITGDTLHKALLKNTEVGEKARDDALRVRAPGESFSDYFARMDRLDHPVWDTVKQTASAVPQGVAAGVIEIVDVAQELATLPVQYLYNKKHGTNVDIDFLPESTKKKAKEAISTLTGYDIKRDEEAVDTIIKAAEATGIDITNPTSWADMIKDSDKRGAFGDMVLTAVENPSIAVESVMELVGSGGVAGVAAKVGAKGLAKLGGKRAVDTVSSLFELNKTAAKKRVMAIKASKDMDEATKKALILATEAEYTAGKKAVDLLKGTTFSNADLATRVNQDIQEYRDNNNGEAPEGLRLAGIIALDKVAAEIETGALRFEAKIPSVTAKALAPTEKTAVLASLGKQVAHTLKSAGVEGAQELSDGILSAVNTEWGTEKYKDKSLQEILKEDSAKILTGAAIGVSGGATLGGFSAATEGLRQSVPIASKLRGMAGDKLQERRMAKVDDVPLSRASEAELDNEVRVTGKDKLATKQEFVDKLNQVTSLMQTENVTENNIHEVVDALDVLQSNKHVIADIGKESVATVEAHYKALSDVALNFIKSNPHLVVDRIPSTLNVEGDTLGSSDTKAPTPDKSTTANRAARLIVHVLQNRPSEGFDKETLSALQTFATANKLDKSYLKLLKDPTTAVEVDATVGHQGYIVRELNILRMLAHNVPEPKKAKEEIEALVNWAEASTRGVYALEEGIKEAQALADKYNSGAEVGETKVVTGYRKEAKKGQEKGDPFVIVVDKSANGKWFVRDANAKRLIPAKKRNLRETNNVLRRALPLLEQYGEVMGMLADDTKSALERLKAEDLAVSQENSTESIGTTNAEAQPEVGTTSKETPPSVFTAIGEAKTYKDVTSTVKTHLYTTYEDKEASERYKAYQEAFTQARKEASSQGKLSRTATLNLLKVVSSKVVKGELIEPRSTTAEATAPEQVKDAETANQSGKGSTGGEKTSSMSEVAHQAEDDAPTSEDMPAEEKASETTEQQLEDPKRTKKSSMSEEVLAQKEQEEDITPEDMPSEPSPRKKAMSTSDLAYEKAEGSDEGITPEDMSYVDGKIAITPTKAKVDEALIPFAAVLFGSAATILKVKNAIKKLPADLRVVATKAFENVDVESSEFDAKVQKALGTIKTPLDHKGQLEVRNKVWLKAVRRNLTQKMHLEDVPIKYRHDTHVAPQFKALIKAIEEVPADRREDAGDKLLLNAVKLLNNPVVYKGITGRSKSAKGTGYKLPQVRANLLKELSLLTSKKPSLLDKEKTYRVEAAKGMIARVNSDKDVMVRKVKSTPTVLTKHLYESALGAGAQPRYEVVTTEEDGTRKYKLAGMAERSNSTLPVQRVAIDPTEYSMVAKETYLNNTTYDTIKAEHPKLAKNVDTFIEKFLASTVAPVTRGGKSAEVDGKYQDTTMMYNSPGRSLLFDKQGNINKNVATAMFIAAISTIQEGKWELTKGPKEVSRVAGLFGVPEFEVTEPMRLFASNHGSLLKTVASNVGRSTATLLGLKERRVASDEINATNYGEFNVMLSDLGNMALLAMAKLPSGVKGEPLLKVEKVSRAFLLDPESLEVSSTDNNGAGPTVPMVLLTTKKGATPWVNELTDTASDMLERMENSYVNLPEGDKIRKEPSYNTPLDQSLKDNLVGKIHKDLVDRSIPQASRDAMQEMMDTPYTITKRGLENFKEAYRLYEDEILANLGYKAEDSEEFEGLAYDSKEGQVGKNRAILQSIEELLALEDKFEESNSDTLNMYFPVKFTVGGRFMVDSNTIQPQGDVLHRFMVTPKATYVTYKVGVAKGLKTFTAKFEGKEKDLSYLVRYNLAQAFGIGVDKTLSEVNISVGEALLNLDQTELDALRHALLGNSKYTLTVNGKPVTLEMESLGHVLQGLDFLQQLQDGNVVYSNLMAEYDSQTSGFANKMQQFPLLGDTQEEVDENLAKVGILTQDYVKNVVNKDSVVFDPANGKGYNDVLAAGEKIGFFDSYKSAAKETITALKSPAYRNEVLQDNGVAIFDNVVPILPGEEVLTGKVNENTIGGQLRSLFKNPFMIFNYSAGLNRIIQNMSDNITESLMDGFASMPLDNPEQKYAKVAQSLLRLGLYITVDNKRRKITTLEQLRRAVRQHPAGSIRLYTPINVINKKAAYNSPVKVSYPKTQTSLPEVLHTLMLATYGKSVKQVFERKYGDFVAIQNATTDAFKVMYRIFEHKLRVALDERKRKTGVLTADDYKVAVAETRDALPYIDGPLSGAYEASGAFDGIAILDSGVSPVAESLFSPRSPAQTAIVDERGKTVTRTVQPVLLQVKEAPNAGAVLPFHYLDGAELAVLIAKLKEEYPEYEGVPLATIHDAELPSALHADDAVSFYNQGQYDLNKGYNLLEAIKSSFERAVASGISTIGQEDFSKLPVEGLTLPDRETVAFSEAVAVVESVLTYQMKNVQTARDEAYKSDGTGFLDTAYYGNMVGPANTIIQPNKGPVAELPGIEVVRSMLPDVVEHPTSSSGKDGTIEGKEPKNSKVDTSSTPFNYKAILDAVKGCK